MSQDSSIASPRAGALFGVAAYGIWGVMPLYFKAVKSIAPAEVLAQRVFWSALLLAALTWLPARRRNMAKASLKPGRVKAGLAATAALIAANWFLFIWAVNSGQTLQASLGYFINPLVNVLLGAVFLRERLSRAAWAGVGLAGLGAAALAYNLGEPPLIALGLAITFGFYGLLRKVLRVEALTGLAVETALLSPFAALYLAWLTAERGEFFGGASWRVDLLLALGGIVTATPLLCFARAARALRMATLGLLLYIAPTGQFLLAVFAFGEPFEDAHKIAFALIWTGLAIYSADALARQRRLSREARAAAVPNAPAETAAPSPEQS